MPLRAIVQARMGSTRLPGKSLKPLAGKPVLLRVIERTALAIGQDNIVVATTRLRIDDPLCDFAERQGAAIFRGDETDVLARFAAAARATDADPVVRITADDPLKDASEIRRAVATLRDGGFDYVSNTIEPTLPLGLDVEVFTRAALERADAEATDAYEREHVTPFIWRRPDRFRLQNLTRAPDLSRYRWTLDTEADFRFLEAFIRRIEADGRERDLDALAALVDSDPLLSALHAKAKEPEFA